MKKEKQTDIKKLVLFIESPDLFKSLQKKNKDGDTSFYFTKLFREHFKIKKHFFVKSLKYYA